MNDYTPYPTSTSIIDAGQVLAFTEAVKADPVNGVPPTYAAVYAIDPGIQQMLSDPEVGMDFARMLHGEQSIEWTRHPRIGETLSTEAWIASDVARGNLRFVTVKALVTDADGSQICIATSVMVQR